MTAAQFQGTTTQTNFGNTGPDMFRGTGYFDVDLRAMKNIPPRERVKLGVGAQFYNLFNHPNFANPSGSVTSSALGTISATVVPPTSIYGSFQSGTVSGRVVVATLKLNF